MRKNEKEGEEINKASEKIRDGKGERSIKEGSTEKVVDTFENKK